MHKIQCQCGQVQGHLSPAARLTHLACHCRDCQTYAHAIGMADTVLDAHGATDVLTTLQQHVTITQGADKLACNSLSDKGLLRWYASCCNTPLANTARDPKLSFVALMRDRVSLPLDGVKRVAVNTRHAKGRVKASASDGLFATLRIIGSVIGARANGSWQRSPFFRQGSGQPVATPRVIKADYPAGR